MPALNDVLSARLHSIPEASRRALVEAHVRHGTHIVVDGREYLHFSGNDYLGLIQHPKVLQAAQNALDTHGAGAGASRLVTGNHAHYGALETALADYLRLEAALVFSSGYAATLGTIAALMEEGDLILADKYAHACMIDGAQLSGAKLMRFAHNDMAHAESILAKHRSQFNNVLIVTEHIFSMDGDNAPLDALIDLKKRYRSWLMVDDAHGIGITYYLHKNDVDIWSGTLSKALASVGGYVAGSRTLMNYLIQSARSMIFSTALPPSAVAAAHAALEIMVAEPERGALALGHAKAFTEALGLPPAHSAIVPVIIGEDADAVAASAALKEQGFWVSAIRPPTVPKGTARLRVTFSAAHTREQVLALAEAVKPWVKS